MSESTDLSDLLGALRRVNLVRDTQIGREHEVLLRFSFDTWTFS